MSSSRLCFRDSSRLTFLIGSVILIFPVLCSAKNSSLSAIEIYPVPGSQGAGSQAYVQINDFSLNSKNELRLCNGASKIDRETYGKLPKIPLAPGMALEREQNGVLMLTRGGQPECAVPGNLKFDKADVGSPAELAEKASLQGQVVSKSDGAVGSVAPLAVGVKLVFVQAPDDELAAFLLAQRSGTITAWKTYLGRFPAAPHTADAKTSLSRLYVQDGDAALGAFKASRTTSTPDYGKLQAADHAFDEARRVDPAAAGEDTLKKNIDQQVADLNQKAQGELNLYRQAFKNQTAGYNHLLAAEAISGITASIAPQSGDALALSRACKEERGMLESRIQSASSKLAAGQPDDAYRTIAPVQPFAPEYARIQDHLDAIYRYHLNLGKKEAAANDLNGAVAEFQKAYDVKHTPEVAALLGKTQGDAEANADKAAVTAALGRSNDAEANKDYVTAYEVLDSLTPAQKTSVSARMDELKDQFVTAATNSARQLQHAHVPVNGPNDEKAVQQAYNLLVQCYQLTNDPDLQDKSGILGDTLSTYYLKQAKQYLDRPDGSGVNVGWEYLEEALSYRASNAGAVHDEMTRARDAHQLKSRLSMRVSFRDTTSHRDAVDFAIQLTDSLAAGLENSGLNIKVIRPNESTVVKPNFQLIGDVLRNSKSTSYEKTPKESRYRSGEHEVPNEDWIAANRVYLKAHEDLQNARSEAEGAMARGKKKEMQDAKKAVADAEKKDLDASSKLDALPKTLSQEIERPYTYTEQTNHLKAVVSLQFKILDSMEAEVVPMVAIPPVEDQKDYKLLEGVKSEDTTGVRVAGEVPSEDQFLETAEDEARNQLLTTAKERVATLPDIVLQNADRRAADGDQDGAAELYFLYLGSTDKPSSSEATKARSFLATNYNFHIPEPARLKGNLVASTENGHR
jgi:hypothetical protein